MSAPPAPETRGQGLSPFFASAAVARIAPFALFMLFVAAGPLLEPWADPRWVTAARGVAVALLLALFWGSYTELRAAPRPRAREWLLAVAVGAAVFAAWITFDSGWAAFDDKVAGFVPLGADGRLDPALVALRLFGLALVVPVMEELFWRSFLLRWIDRRDFLAADPRNASVAAFGISCALFAVEHSQWFAGLIAGAAYAGLYMRSRNLWIPIVSHATTNAILGFWILTTGNWRFW